MTRPAIDDKEFKPPDGVFWTRGITKTVARGAFFPYAQGDADAVLRADPRIPADAVARVAALVQRAPGFVMRRWAVPGADPFILAELRPEWAIWTGKRPRRHTHQGLPAYSRDLHVARSKTTPDQVRRGTTELEYAWISALPGFDVTGGGDHHGLDTNLPHVHIKIAKYLFQENEHTEIIDPDGPHAHTDAMFDDPWEMFRHLRYDHGGAKASERAYRRGPVLAATGERMKDPTPMDKKLASIFEGSAFEDPIPHGEIHDHMMTVDSTRYAKRLSIHPMSLKRLPGAGRVMMAAEGCLKEAALVRAGEATFSCPSVSLWDAPELERFAREHLAGKVVFVICDSDWRRPDDDSVVRQTLNARERLRSYGVEAYAAAPPPGGEGCTHKDFKHGQDDVCAPGICHVEIDDLPLIEREMPMHLADWLDLNPPPGRKPRSDGIERDWIVLKGIALRASVDGVSKVALRALARSLCAELGARDTEAAYKSVRLALGNLEAYGVVTGVESLKDRTGYHLRRIKEDWAGKLTIAAVDLRAVEPPVPRTVGEVSGALRRSHGHK